METHGLGRQEETAERDAGYKNSAGSTFCSRSQGVIFHVSNGGFVSGLDFLNWI